MKTLSELLREADPLSHEPPRSASERRVSRQAVLDSPRVDVKLSRRSMAIVVVVALALLAIVSGSRFWSSTVEVLAAVRFEVRLAEENPAAGLREAVIAASARKIYLHQETVVTNGDIAKAEVVPGQPASTFGISVIFNANGAAKMLRASQSHLGKPAAILLGGKVVSAPTIKSPISTSAFISGNYTRADADRIVAGIIGQ